MTVYRINPGDLATGSGVPSGFTQRWHDEGYNLSHPHFGLPLPWGEDADMNYFMRQDGLK